MTNPPTSDAVNSLKQFMIEPEGLRQYLSHLAERRSICSKLNITLRQASHAERVVAFLDKKPTVIRAFVALTLKLCAS